MKYNYVIFATDDEYYKVAYNDLNKLNNVKYVWRELDTDNRIITLFYKMHTSPKTNKIFSLPFKKLWNPCMFRNTFSDDKPICFIFFPGRRKEYNNGLVEYLRNRYPDSKFVLYYQDLIKKSKMPEINLFKKQFDLILSFDHEDAFRNNLEYYPLVYSAVEVPDGNIEKSDVYFVGKAKDRLKDIQNVYDKLRNNGLKCDFHVTGVAEKEIRQDGIIYNTPVSYLENIQRIKATKCMVELMQKGGHGFTLRYCEAIMYNKKIITNNCEVKKAAFFSEDRIQAISNLSEIDTKFVLKEPITVDYNYKKKLSPILLLNYIEDFFQKNI